MLPSSSKWLDDVEGRGFGQTVKIDNSLISRHGVVPLWTMRICVLLLRVMKKLSKDQNQQAATERELYTLTPVTPPLDSRPGVVPTWIRLPKSGSLCPYTGLSRSGLNSIILGTNPPVKSVSLKKRYAIRGTRLIHLASLLEYIEGMADSQCNEHRKEVKSNE